MVETKEVRKHGEARGLLHRRRARSIGRTRHDRSSRAASSIDPERLLHDDREPRRRPPPRHRQARHVGPGRPGLRRRHPRQARRPGRRRDRHRGRGQVPRRDHRSHHRTRSRSCRASTRRRSRRSSRTWRSSGPSCRRRPTRTDAARGHRPSQDAPSLNGQAQIVILSVTAQQAEVLRFGQIDGTITLVLRSPDDKDAPNDETTGITLRQLVDNWAVIPPQVVETVLPKQTAR